MRAALVSSNRPQRVSEIDQITTLAETSLSPKGIMQILTYPFSRISDYQVIFSPNAMAFKQKSLFYLAFKKYLHQNLSNKNINIETTNQFAQPNSDRLLNVAQLNENPEQLIEIDENTVEEPMQIDGEENNNANATEEQTNPQEPAGNELIPQASSIPAINEEYLQVILIEILLPSKLILQ